MDVKLVMMMMMINARFQDGKLTLILLRIQLIFCTN